MTPIVAVGVDGGLVQWTMAAAGEGMPKVYVLDFDREGAEAWEWDHLAETIAAAVAEFERHDLPSGAQPDGIATAEGLATLRETLTDVRASAAEAHERLGQGEGIAAAIYGPGPEICGNCDRLIKLTDALDDDGNHSLCA
jgi:hypothetical protein